MPLAQDLLRVGAVTLRPDAPFTWASGLRSPIYTDIRRTLGFPDVRQRLAEGLAATVADGAEVVAGTATAGIPWGAMVADRLAFPMAYVRSAAKAHGQSRRIEGADVAGRRVVLVEDTISTGGSALDAVRALREAGAEVVGVAAIYTYALPAAEATLEGLPTVALVSFHDLLAAAALPRDAEASLRAWHADPKAWSDAHA